MQSESPGKASTMVFLRTEGTVLLLADHSLLLAPRPCSPPCNVAQEELTQRDRRGLGGLNVQEGWSWSFGSPRDPGDLITWREPPQLPCRWPRVPRDLRTGSRACSLDDSAAGLRCLCPAPLGSAGAGGVTVSGQDFVSDPAALPLVRPVFTPQV